MLKVLVLMHRCNGLQRSRYPAPLFTEGYTQHHLLILNLTRHCKHSDGLDLMNLWYESYSMYLLFIQCLNLWKVDTKNPYRQYLLSSSPSALLLKLRANIRHLPKFPSSVHSCKIYHKLDIHSRVSFTQDCWELESQSPLFNISLYRDICVLLRRLSN